MKGVCFVGSLQWGHQSTGGGVQTKNQYILQYILEKYDGCSFYDTFGKNYLISLLGALTCILKSKTQSVVILSLSYPAAFILGKLFKILRLQRRFIYLVPGGDFPDYLQINNVAKKKIFSIFEGIYVQAKFMKKNLDDMGYENVKILPNFKPIIFRPQINKERGKCLKFVFLSRIKNDKGVEEIVSAVRRINRKNISVDFYGSIIKPFNEDYFTSLRDNNIQYKGFLDLSTIKGYEILSSYDVLLFPTYYNGEGFPGVLIDSFIAGVPVIATDFHANGEVIKNNINGMLVPVKDVDKLVDAMVYLQNNTNFLNKLRKGAIESASQYDMYIILNQLFNELGIRN